MNDVELARRVVARLKSASYFSLGDIVLFGKYKNKKGVIKSFGKDKWGNPTIEVEPIPKGRKQNKIIHLFKIWRADVKEKALAEMAKDLPKTATALHLAAKALADDAED